MAHFRAIVKGNRGLASRLGSKDSGMYVRLQTWGYDVSLSAYHSVDGADWAEVALICGGESFVVGDFNLTTGKLLLRKSERIVPA